MPAAFLMVVAPKERRRRGQINRSRKAVAEKVLPRERTAFLISRIEMGAEKESRRGDAPSPSGFRLPAFDETIFVSSRQNPETHGSYRRP
jgi:hypothetical protein